MILVHASDLHFGKPHRPTVREALRGFIQETAPDVVVLSGDLTQRAKVREFEEARRFLEGLAPLPLVTTVGNHDVPLYRFWERLFIPYRNYRRFINTSLDTVLDIPGARIVALSTAAPRSQIVNGRLGRAQLRFAAEAFREMPAGHSRILVLHHHVLGPGDREADVPLPAASRIIRSFHSWGVDLVLSGHLHRSFIKMSDEGLPGGLVTRGIPIVHSGTTTSSRGRGREKGRSSLNLIRVEDMEIEVSVYLYSRTEERFVRDAVHRYPRHPR